MTPTLKPYPAYRDSGVEWLGRVPAHWEIRRIKTLFREKDERSEDATGELLSLTRAQGIVKQSEASSRVARAEDLSKYKSCQPGDLVMNRMQAWSGMFAVSSLHGLISPDYSIFVPTEPLEEKYFERLFKTPLLVHQFAQQSKGIGSGFNRLYTTDFGAIPVVAPPLSEQAAIARYLDHIDTRVTRVIHARQRLARLLEEQKHVIIRRAVTGQIDVRTGEPYPAYRDSGVEWLGRVPAHWEVRRLRACVRNVVEQTDQPRESDLCVALENVESWTGRLAVTDAGPSFSGQAKRFRPGDILFGKLRPYLAKVAVAPGDGVCVTEFLVLRPANHAVGAQYLELVLRSRAFTDVVSGSTSGAKMPRAEWPVIGSTRIPLPPLSEQTAIARYLDKALAATDAAIALARREVELLRELRTRLIADVVTGKLDVREAAAALPDEAEEPGPPPEEEWPAEESEEAGIDEDEQILEEAGA